MKKFLLLIFLIIGAFVCNAQTYEQRQHIATKVIHQRFNDVVYGNLNNPTFVYLTVFVVREMTGDPAWMYRYQIMVINHSHYNGNSSSVYMSGVRAFANGSIISGEYTNGFWAIISPDLPTEIFWYKANDQNLNFSINWQNIRHY